MGRVSDSYDEIGETVSDAVADKLGKLNDHYSLFSENDLVLVLDEFIDYGLDIIFSFEEMFTPVLDCIKKVYQNGYDKVFDYVYILFNDCVVEVSTKEWSYNYKKIDQNDWNLVKLKMNTEK